MSSSGASLAVTDARGMWALQLTVGLLGATATGAALLIAVTRIDFRIPSPAELGAACQRYALPLVQPLSIFVLLMGSASLAALALTARSVVRQLSDGRRLERDLALLGPLPGAARAYVVDGDEPQAFCIGPLRPRIYLSRGALALLNDAEREAVLAHEIHHARRRDPLRLLIARALGEGLFFLPAVRHLAERCATLAELAADEAAVSKRGGRPALASALLAFDAHPSPAAAGIAPERVDHLLGQRAQWELPTVLLLGALATIGALVALTLRVADATEHGTVGLPMLLAQACMPVMAVGPIVVGAMTLLGGRRLVRGRPRSA